MKPNFIPHEKEFTVEFGKLLIRHQREIAEAQATGGQIDHRAKKFARYLRAARSHAGLTPPELAQKAEIPEPMIYALERGMISSKRMQIAHLQRLASALDEEVEMFALILDRDLSTPVAINTILNSGFRACLLLGLMLMALFALSPSSYNSNDQYLATWQEAPISGAANPVEKAVHTVSTSFNTSIDEWLVELKNQITDKPSGITASFVLYAAIILALLSLLLWLIIQNSHFLSGMKWHREFQFAAPLLVTACLLFAVVIMKEDSFGNASWSSRPPSMSSVDSGEIISYPLDIEKENRLYSFMKASELSFCDKLSSCSNKITIHTPTKSIKSIRLSNLTLIESGWNLVSINIEPRVDNSLWSGTLSAELGNVIQYDSVLGNFYTLTMQEYRSSDIQKEGDEQDFIKKQNEPSSYSLTKSNPIHPPDEIDYRTLIKQQALLIWVILLIIGFLISKTSQIILLITSRRRT